MSNLRSPADLIATNSALLQSITPALARGLETINPVAGQFCRSMLDVKNPEHVSALVDTAAEALPLNDLQARLARNLANTAEPVGRPDNFIVPETAADVAQDNAAEQAYDAGADAGMKR